MQTRLRESEIDVLTNCKDINEDDEMILIGEPTKRK